MESEIDPPETLTTRYEIQSGVHDPFVDCVSTMRLYKKMRDQDHRDEGFALSIAPQKNLKWGINIFGVRKDEELEGMKPDELFKISSSNYRCWCLDRTDPSSIVSLEEREDKMETPWLAWPMEGPFRILSF